MPLLRTGEKEQTRRDNFKNKHIKRKKQKRKTTWRLDLATHFCPAVLSSVSRQPRVVASKTQAKGGGIFWYLIWRLMTGKKADYPRSKSQLEIQEKGRVCGVWKLGIDDNYADADTDE